MVMVDLKQYQKYVTYDSKGNTMLYVEMNKALYGLLQSALLLYKKFSKDLEAYGNVINNYCPCVANSMIDGHQMKVTWYVDYLKVSHNDPTISTSFPVTYQAFMWVN